MDSITILYHLQKLEAFASQLFALIDPIQVRLSYCPCQDLRLTSKYSSFLHLLKCKIPIHWVSAHSYSGTGATLTTNTGFFSYVNKRHQPRTLGRSLPLCLTLGIMILALNFLATTWHHCWSPLLCTQMGEGVWLEVSSLTAMTPCNCLEVGSGTAPVKGIHHYGHL